MPYISDREQFEQFVESIPEMPKKGHLEYLIFCLMLRYMSTRGTNYSNLHDTVYAAQHCADEFRRRFLDKYEDCAINANGDIR